MGTSSESFHHDLIDRVIAEKFRIRRCVGLGASGAVYQADQMALGRTVAVKVLRPELAADPKIVARFQDEALAASRLNHPNTVSIIDYGQTPDGLLYLVMEFLRGKTLTQLVQSQMPLPTARIGDMVSQILSGLEEAHASGVIHADLKSDNIIVERRRGGWDLVKVVDFGVARILGVTQRDESDKTICGTPEYMAPEIITGREPTVASDLYAVGVVLYELLAGMTPFGDSTRIVDVLTRQIKEPPVPPSKRAGPGAIAHDVDPGLEEIALRALAKTPRERFADASDFRRAIADAVQPRVTPAGDEVLCDECGARAAKSFKFCPECGHPRGSRSKTTPLPRPEPLLQRDASAGGLFPLPFVGRDEQMNQLLAFVRGNTDRGAMQLVSEPGGGRTRLVREACARIDDVIIYAAFADPSGLASPFYPIRAIVAAILELPPVCTYEQLHAALELKGLSRRDLPGIGELFGHEGELFQLEPPVRRRELLASTTRVLRAAGDCGRALLLFEDADQYDNPSQELLRRLTETANEDDPLRILVTNGPEFANRWGPRVARLDVTPLAPDMVGLLLDHAATLDLANGDGRERLIEITGGVPLTVEQMLRFLHEGGGADEAPETEADLIDARLSLLPRQALLVAQAASVFGGEVLRHILELTLAAEIGDEALDEALALLVARGVLTEEAPVIAFTAQLVRDVIYDATPADVRRTLHSAAALALQGALADPSVVGYHHDLAGDLETAADLLGQAGDIAVHSFDDVGASRLYQRGLSAARRLMLATNDEDSRMRFVTLSVKLAESLRIGGEVGLARGVVEEAKGHCHDAPALAAQLLRASAHLSLTEGNTEDAVATIRRAIGQTIPTGRIELLCDLYLDLSSMLLRDARSSIASFELEEAVNMVTLGEGPEGDNGPENLWRLLLRMAQLHAALDHHQHAQRFGESALRHAKRVQSRVGSARVQTMLAAHFERLRDMSRAESYRQAAVDEMRRLGDRRGTAELLLHGVTPTRTIRRISPESLHEARVLAQEVGWEEGIARTITRTGD